MKCFRITQWVIFFSVLASSVLSASPIVEWSQVLPPSKVAFLVDAVPTPDGGYALFGSVQDELGTYQLRLIKLDSLGATQWIYTSSEDQDTAARSGIVTADGGYYVAGDSSRPGSAATSALAQKISWEGELTWGNGYGTGSEWTLQHTLLCELSPNTFVVFNTAAGETKTTLHTILTEQGRTTIGIVDCPDLGGAIATDMAALEDGKFVLSARSTSIQNQEEAGWLIFLERADRCGWMARIEGDGAGWARAITTTADGRIAVCGSASPSATYSADIYVASFSADGAQLWYRTYGGPGAHVATEIVATPGGGAVIVGTTLGYAGEKGVLVFEIGSGGEVLWSKVVGEPYEAGVSIHRTADGGYLVGANLPEQGGVRIVKLSLDPR